MLSAETEQKHCKGTVKKLKQPPKKIFDGMAVSSEDAKKVQAVEGSFFNEMVITSFTKLLSSAHRRCTRERYV